MQRIISAEALGYSYGQQRAVGSVSFHVDAGEVYGLLGPNGAGKTTLINMLASLLTPDSGRILFNSSDLTGKPELIRPQLGVVPQEISLYDELSGRENLAFFGTLYGMSGNALRQRVEHVLEQVGLAKDADRRLGSYSGGMKRRINIGASLLHEPQLILMDEPTVGVDPQSRNYIYELITGLAASDTAVLYTTHYMEEAQRLCRRIGIMDHGDMIAEGSVDALLELLPARDMIRIQLDGMDETELAKLASGPLSAFGTTLEAGRLLVHTDNAGRQLAAVSAALGEHAARISDLAVERANLENVFLHLTGRSLRED
ncbi:ABC transporter ATP-binding protein [bacterium]|nr:ABC transporter ATP-binding protein [bacterium]